MAEHNTEDEETRFQYQSHIWENQFKQREFNKRFEVSVEPLTKIISKLEEESKDLKKRIAKLEKLLRKQKILE